MNQSLSLIANKNDDQINKTLKKFKDYLLSINTGKTTPKLVEDVYIESNLRKMKISHLSTIIVKNNTIIITPWDKKNIKSIEKAILESTLKFVPQNDGKQILIKVLPLTKDDRIKIVKELKKQGEYFKISIRQIRKNYNNLIKLHIKENTLSSNLEKKFLNIIQKQTNDGIKEIDKYIKNKTQNIMVL